MLKNFNTYTIGILHTKTYRILTSNTTDLLRKHNLVPNEWAIIGLIKDNEEIRPSKLAAIMDVKQPYITRMVDMLNKKTLIKKTVENDSRAYIVSLTAKGNRMVEEIEIELRENMKLILNNCTREDLHGYFNVLNNIVDNSMHIRK